MTTMMPHWWMSEWWEIRHDVKPVDKKMSANTTEEHELEKRIEELESMAGYGSQLFEEVRHKISDLKHQLWQSRL